jgi:hypothetical protein
VESRELLSIPFHLVDSPEKTRGVT